MLLWTLLCRKHKACFYGQDQHGLSLVGNNDEHSQTNWGEKQVMVMTS